MTLDTPASSEIVHVMAFEQAEQVIPPTEKVAKNGPTSAADIGGVRETSGCLSTFSSTEY